MATLYHAIFILAVLQFSCSYCSSLQVKDGGVELFQLSEDVTEGKYTDEQTGQEIRFTSKSNGHLSIATSSGRYLINSGNMFYIENEPNSIAQVGDRSFLRQTNGDYYLSSSEVTKLYNALENVDMQDTTAAAAVLQGIDKGDTTFHRQAVHDSIISLLDDSHYPLVNQAVHYMGETMELTGDEYPSLLPLYLMAMKLEEIDDRIEMEAEKYDPDEGDQEGRELSRSKSRGRREMEEFDVQSSIWRRIFRRRRGRVPRDLRCLYKRPRPCPRYNCFGMCGRGCTCWYWVCRTCRYQYACFRHDLQCANCGFHSLQCFLTGPKRVPFRCNVRRRPRYTRRCFW